MKEDSLDFMEIWNYFVKNWKWFVVSVIAFLLVAGIYLWFTPTKMNVMGKMQVIDRSKRSGQLSMGMSMLNSLPMGLGSSLGGSLGAALGGGIETEEEILMSNNLSRDVVNELGLYTEYHLKKWGRKTLLYKNQPVSVTISPDLLKKLEDKLPLKLIQIKLTITKSASGYTVEPIFKVNKEETELPEQTFTKLPATIDVGEGTLALCENPLLEDEDIENYQDGYTLKVNILPPSERAAGFVEHLTVERTLSKAPDIIEVILEDESVVRATDFVSTLVDLYNKRVNEEKNEEAVKTDEFVNQRLANLDVELGLSDAAWEKSKKNFQITDPTADAQEILQNKSAYESKMVEVGTQIQIHDYLQEYIDNPANTFELIPVGLGGIVDSQGDHTSGLTSSKSSLIEQHNMWVSQRKELLKSMTEKSPMVMNLTASIEELHPLLQTAMKRDRQNLIMKRDALEREFNKYMGRVSSAPQMERVLTEIGRQREIKQGVYLLMLQQREETAMTLANITDKGKLIDDVRMVRNSKHPKKMIVLIGAILLGFVFPMPFLFFKRFAKSSPVTLMMVSLLVLSSCMSTKNVPYFNNIEDIDTSHSMIQYEAKIMPKDILQIKVFSTTPRTAEVFNLEKNQTTSSTGTTTTSQNSVYNYYVDVDGDIRFPVVGTIHLGGLTQKEAESLIMSKISPYIAETEDAFVHVRMVNYKYSVLGEVKSPGTFTTQSEKVNIIEAIAQAGDLTLYGLRDKVYIIRENTNGQKDFHQLNLNDANIISSPYYYLQQNDIVYVVPNKAQARSSYFSTNSSIWLSITSTLVTLSTLIIALTK